MTRKALVVARAVGAKLPKFRNAIDARRALFGQRDRSLADLRALDAERSGFTMDETPDSLLALETWYFALVARRGFARLGTDRARFESAMGFYFGAVAVRHAKARWIVEESAFAPGGYEVGVTRGQFSLLGIETLCEDWHTRPNNKTHRALAREYAQHFAPSRRARTSKPKGELTGDAIETEVLRILARKSTPSRYPWQLADEVRDKLGVTKAKLPNADVEHVLGAMEKRKRIVRVEHGGRGRYSVTYELGAHSKQRK